MILSITMYIKWNLVISSLVISTQIDVNTHMKLTCYIRRKRRWDWEHESPPEGEGKRLLASTKDRSLGNQGIYQIEINIWNCIWNKECDYIKKSWRTWKHIYRNGNYIAGQWEMWQLQQQQQLQSSAATGNVLRNLQTIKMSERGIKGVSENENRMRLLFYGKRKNWHIPGYPITWIFKKCSQICKHWEKATPSFFNFHPSLLDCDLFDFSTSSSHFQTISLSRILFF